METKDVLKAQFTENTGSHFLDSGGAYGRHHERNQGRDFDSEPTAEIEFWSPEGEDREDDLYVTVNTYKWLLEVVEVEFDEEMQARYDKFVEGSEESHYQDRDNFIAHLAEEFGATGLYGESEPMVINTYNHESNLDQTLLYAYFELDGESYILLQVHGGCDVRGGYTAPKAYMLPHHTPETIFDTNRASLTDGENRWFFDGYEWQDEEGNKFEFPKRFKTNAEGKPLSPLNDEPLEAYAF